MNSTAENFMDRSGPFVASCVDENLEDVSCARSEVRISVRWVDSYTVDEPFVLCQLAVNIGQLARLLVHCPEFNRIVMTSNEAIRDRVEELDILALLLQLGRCWTVSFGSALIHVPNNDLIAVTNAAQRNEVGLIATER